jgi:hypothetical protein
MTRRTVQLKEVEKEPGYGWATERYLRRLVAERRIPFYKPDFKIMIDLTDLDTYLEGGRIEPPERVYRPAQNSGGGRRTKVVQRGSSD